MSMRRFPDAQFPGALTWRARSGQAFAGSSASTVNLPKPELLLPPMPDQESAPKRLSERLMISLFSARAIT